MLALEAVIVAEVLLPSRWSKAGRFGLPFQGSKTFCSAHRHEVFRAAEQRARSGGQTETVLIQIVDRSTLKAKVS